jgi:hypothetical protein
MVDGELVLNYWMKTAGLLNKFAEEFERLMNLT